ncbi:5791_t:CDS:1, partial [Entrophospora sp. SA101]
HDGILFMKLHGIKREMGFVEVVGNVLIKNTSSKNDDLEKLLK